MCVILLSMTMKHACRVGACSVGCGRPGLLFGPVVPYFEACGGGWVSRWSVVVVVLRLLYPYRN